MGIKSEIIGTGSYLPEKIRTNADLEKMVETTDAWIQERTGICERHIAAEGEFTSDLAYKAAVRAIEAAGIMPGDIDLIIVATTTPDNVFPASATRVQALLGIKHGAAFDIQAACTGFIYALHLADSLIKTGQYRNVLVIGAETMSRLVDWGDRNTCVLFGDGSGAVVLRGYESKGGKKEPEIVDALIRSDGEYYESLKQTGGVSSCTHELGNIHMEGREVFKHAVTNLAEVAETILERNGITGDDLDLFIPHQANLRIIEGTAKKMKFPLEKTITTVYHQANTSAASIPLAMDYAIREGRMKKGDLVLLDGMGAGFTWGAALIRY